MAVAGSAAIRATCRCRAVDALSRRAARGRSVRSPSRRSCGRRRSCISPATDRASMTPNAARDRAHGRRASPPHVDPAADRQDAAAHLGRQSRARARRRDRRLCTAHRSGRRETRITSITAASTPSPLSSMNTSARPSTTANTSASVGMSACPRTGNPCSSSNVSASIRASRQAARSARRARHLVVVHHHDAVARGVHVELDAVRPQLERPQKRRAACSPGARAARRGARSAAERHRRAARGPVTNRVNRHSSSAGSSRSP